MDFLFTFLNVWGLWCSLGLLVVFFVGLWIWTALARRTRRAGEMVSRKNLMAFQAFAGLVFLVWLAATVINPDYLGYGYSLNGSEVFARGEKVLWLKDYDLQSSGGLGATVRYRLQGIRLSDGDRVFRKLSSDPLDAVWTGGRRVWAMRSGDLLEMDGDNGRILRVFDKTTLKARYPGLGAVYSYALDTARGGLDVVRMDGGQAFIELDVRGKNRAKPSGALELDAYAVRRGDGRVLMSLEERGDQGMLFGADRARLDNSPVFLKGRFIETDAAGGAVYTFSYNRLDKGEFLVRSISPKGTVLWQMGQSQIGLGDVFQRRPAYVSAFLNGPDLIVVLDGFVFSLEAGTGKLNWSVRT